MDFKIKNSVFFRVILVFFMICNGKSFLKKAPLRNFFQYLLHHLSEVMSPFRKCNQDQRQDVREHRRVQGVFPAP